MATSRKKIIKRTVKPKAEMKIKPKVEEVVPAPVTTPPKPEVVTKIVYKTEPKTPPKSFWVGMITENDPRSSRRLITLVIAFVFIVTCITVLVLLISTFALTTRLVNINIEALKLQIELLTQVLYYEYMIILVGLSLITAPQFAKVLTSSLSSLVSRRRRSTDDSDMDTSGSGVNFEDVQEFVPQQTDPQTKQTVTKETKVTPPDNNLSNEVE